MAEPIGLRRGTVNVVAYQPGWAAAFDKEKHQLLDAIGNYVPDIEHVGSTSVPDLAAKPIIDMLAAVDDTTLKVTDTDSFSSEDELVRFKLKDGVVESVNYNGATMWTELGWIEKQIKRNVVE